MKSPVTFLLITVISLSNLAFGQTEEPLNQLSEDEQMVVEAIALYPKEQREEILLVSANPEILVRLSKIQENSAAEFKEIMSDLEFDVQKKIYDLVRFPDLVGEICNSGEKRKESALKDILDKGDYPESVRQNASFLNKHYFNTLNEINELTARSEANFTVLIAPYGTDIQKAAMELVGLPEVLSLLNENINMTILLGDIYTRDPVWLMNELDRLNTELAEEKTRELNEWKESLESDSQAMKDYEAAAQEFADEEGYRPGQYYGEVDMNTIYVQSYWHPYPYWYGYPYWYSYPYWYEYPWWYHWGYYYGPNRTVVIIGLPSTTFVHWHFEHAHHFHRYPHFTDQYIRHYHHHRRSRSSVTTVVRHWEREVTPQVPRNFMTEDEGRVKRIQDYGHYREDYDKKVIEARGQTPVPSQREFLKDNADKYPAMKPMLSEKQETRPVRPKAEQHPAARPGKIDRPAKPDQPVIEKRKVVTPPSRPDQQKKTNQKEIIRGWDYHNNTWERQQKDIKVPERRTPVPSQKPAAPAKRDAPVQQRAPAKQQAPTKQAPRKDKVQPR